MWICHSSRFQRGLGPQLQVYIIQGRALFTMNYQSSSRSQKKRSPTSAYTASPSRQAAPTTSAPPSLRYFTAVASSSIPYESPYTQDQDKPSSDRSTSRSTGVYPTLSEPSTTRAPQSEHSSSSGSSIYDYPSPRDSRNTAQKGTMSTQRTMSSVSFSSIFSSLFGHLRISASSAVFSSVHEFFF